jgi:hypothetical protein
MRSHPLPSIEGRGWLRIELRGGLGVAKSPMEKEGPGVVCQRCPNLFLKEWNGCAVLPAEGTP